MSFKGTKYMWILVFFDLPVVKKKDRKEAAEFRKFLLKDGYSMLQYSIYARVCDGDERVQKHIKRLKLSVPAYGSVRALTVTDLQYGKMHHLLGKKRPFESKNGFEQLTLF